MSLKPYEVLAFFCLMALLIFAWGLPDLKLYEEGWYPLYVGSSQEGFAEQFQAQIDFLAEDRPTSGIPFALNYALLGSNVQLWHFSTVILRILAAFAAYGLCLSLWPGRYAEAVVVGLLFLVYPGFTQQSALNYQYVWLMLSLQLLSLIAMAHSLRTSGRKALAWGLLAVFTGFIPTLLIEYYIGLEAMRLLILLYLLREQAQPPWGAFARRVLQHWYPYLMGIGVYFVLRFLLLSPSTRGGQVRSENVLEPYRSNFPDEFFLRPLKMIEDTLETSLMAWYEPFVFVLEDTSLLSTKRFVALALLAGLLMLVYLFSLARRGYWAAGADTWAKTAVLLGLFSVALSLAPLILVQREVRLVTEHLTWDRYALPGMMGASLFMAGLIFSLPTRWLQAIVLSSLVVLGSYSHLGLTQRANLISKDLNQWAWQNTWRAPDLHDGSSLIFINSEIYIMPIVTANSLYRYGQPQPTVNNYFLAHTRNDLLTQNKTSYRIRSLEVALDYRQSVLVLFTPSCVYLLDQGGLVMPPEIKTPALDFWEGYSNPQAVILPSSAAKTPSRNFFGPEPARTWCYYFQQAHRARQAGDWPQVAEYAYAVIEAGHQTPLSAEWLVFIEGLIHMGDYATATARLQQVLAAPPFIDDNSDPTVPRPLNYHIQVELCKFLARLQSQDEATATYAQATGQAFSCPEELVQSFIVPQSAWGGGEPLRVYSPTQDYLPLVRFGDFPWQAIRLGGEEQEAITAWQEDLDSQHLKAAGIDYLLVDAAWEIHWNPKRLIGQANGYELLYEETYPRSGEFYRLYRLP
jgi:hypothetical protein